MVGYVVGRHQCGASFATGIPEAANEAHFCLCGSVCAELTVDLPCEVLHVGESAARHVRMMCSRSDRLGGFVLTLRMSKGFASAAILSRPVVARLFPLYFLSLLAKALL